MMLSATSGSWTIAVRAVLRLSASNIKSAGPAKIALIAKIDIAMQSMMPMLHSALQTAPKWLSSNSSPATAGRAIPEARIWRALASSWLCCPNKAGCGLEGDCVRSGRREAGLAAPALGCLADWCDCKMGALE